MTWRIVVRADAEADFERLDEADQRSLSEELFRWVEEGPPRQTPRDVLGIEMFDDSIAGGFRITYVVDDSQKYILVVRILKVPSAP